MLVYVLDISIIDAGYEYADIILTLQIEVRKIR